MDSTTPMVVIYLYKSLVVLVGLVCICLGAWLALRKVNARGGSIEASAGKLFGIKMTRPTIGTLLVVAGAVIIVFAVTRPFRYETNRPPVAPASPGAPDTTGEHTGISDTVPARPGVAPPPEAPHVIISDTASIQPT